MRKWSVLNGKKIGCVILAGITAVGLAACGGAAGTGSSAAGTINQKTVSTAAAAKTTAAAVTAAKTTAAAAKTTAAAIKTTAAAAKTAAASGSVTCSGSSALLPLVQAAAEKYMKINAGITIAANGGGSGTGLKQVSDGAVDIGDSDVFAEEKLDAALASALKDHKVCTVTMAAVVNKSLGVKNLTTQQLTDIFTGKVQNWKEVGGPDKGIMLITRPSSSGTRALFKKWALGGAEEADHSALETDDSGTLLQTVQDNDGAIGYAALSYLVNNDKVTGVAIDGVDPTLENTCSGKYKVWGFEHMYTKGDGSPAAKAFIDYMTGKDFASSIESMGYGIASKMTDAAVAAHK
jgi:phosphate transport system substrate-binding protein